MRIPEKSLDDFLRCVGELLGVEEMLRNLMRLVGSGADSRAVTVSLRDVTSQFELISSELRSRIMEVRKVEASVLLQKTPRIVRDVAALAGKKIEVVCTGETLMIDKSYIDLLDAPLTHMVRNAADHGIELPEARRARGKAETGTVSITLREQGNDLQLIVQDDGEGLNYAGLQKKAEQLGLVPPGASLETAEIIELIFRSGVSTAREVTDVSGRGVGMDVVKRAVTDAGGRITVESIAGRGVTFTIAVPRNASTQILDGYMVRSFSGAVYIFPLGAVVEAFRIVPEDITGVIGQGRAITRRGTIVPLYTIDSLLEAGDPVATDSDVQDTMGVLLTIKGVSAVITVREVLGIQKVVSKPVEGSVLDNEMFTGAAISGIGHVSMIVNLEKLLGR
jgi:two-component system chemotaxis sensor kinase CheA